MKTFKQFIREIANKGYRDSWYGVKRGQNKSTYDPKHADVKPDKLKDADDKTIGWKHKVKTKKHVVSRASDIIAKDDNVIHRGMSHDEYHNMVKAGKIKSRGTGNIGDEQKGTTSFTTNPDSADAYSNSFTMSKHKPTPKKHAYIVSIKRPHPSKIIPHVKGTSEDEVGVRGSVSTDHVVAVHRGRVIAHTPEDKGKGFHVSASSRLHWEKIK